MLRKLLYSTALLIGAGLSVSAQSEKAPSVQLNDQTQSISNAGSFSAARKASPSNQMNALFDVQFNYNATAQRGSGGMAAVVWTGTEFWVSAWANDSLFTFDASGTITSRFKVAGVGTSNSGVRAMTWDGTNIYAGANTNTIYEINPVTKTMTATIAAPDAVRGLSYDSTADGGAGGFWVSNYSTNISLISRTGSLLNLIPAAVHGLTAMYGIAVDHYSTGGPYMWVFDQGSSSGQSDLRRIPIATSVPDLFMHSVMSDVGSGGASGLAGGLCIGWGLDSSGHRSIIGLLQGTPNDRLFGYELGDFIPPDVDASADKLNFSPPVTFIPKHLVSATFWDMDVRNMGVLSIDTLSLIVDVDSSGTNLFSTTTQMYNIAPGASINIPTINAYTPADKALYNVTARLSTGSQTDEVGSNDTIAYELVVNDSVMGVDNNIIDGALGIGAPGGVLGQKFTVSSLSFASSASAFFRSPTAGDSIRFALYAFNTTPQAVITSTATYVFTLSDQTNGVFLTLPFNTAPHQLNAGTYFLGAVEGGNNMSMATCAFNFQPATAYGQVPPATTWSTLESVGFENSLILRLNILDPLFVSVPSVYKQEVFTMHPNPAVSRLTVKSSVANTSATLSLFDITGREVYKQTGIRESNEIELVKFSEGIYVVQMIVDGNVYSEKLTISK